MNRLGLLGYPLGHSLSPEKWQARFQQSGLANDWSYSLFEVEHPDRIIPYLRGIEDLRGFNITIPYKELFLKHCHYLSPEAASIGAVNTVKVLENGHFSGFNTDAPALKAVIEGLIPHPFEISALILGTGGSSKAAEWACKNLGITYTLVSRSTKPNTLTYTALTEEIVSEKDLIIQTTPLGMYPNVEAMPEIPLNGLRKGQFLIDLIYNPEVTLLMREAANRGVKAVNGMQMLQIQADLAWEIFKN